MKLIEVQFTEWRDGAAAAPELVLAATAAEDALAREATVRKELSGIDAMLAITETEDLQRDRAGAAVAVVTTMKASAAALAAQETAALAAGRAMKQHAMVGRKGYQVLNGEGTEVVKVVDADGNDLPEGAVYGYSVTTTKPAMPDWAIKADAVEVKGVSA